jgi:dihydrofolate reductase
MRNLRYLVAASLDGFIAGPRGEADWIVMDPEIDFAALMGQFDTLLMGRKTFAATGGGMSGGMRVVVVSSTLSPADNTGITILAGDLAAGVQALKAEPGKDIWLFGGGELFRSLLAIGLVDSVEVAVIPVLLGGGIPLLPPPAARTTLALAGHRVYERTGTVLLEYAVAPSGEGARPARRRRRGSGSHAT